MADDPQRQLDQENAQRVAVASNCAVPAVGLPPIRLAFVDGLRGLAALGIAVYHIWRYEPPPYSAIDVTPGIVEWVLLRSWVGVQFLLVISGFVIAFTLRDTWVTPREVVSFIARRIVRLTPPYWVTLAVVLGLHAVNSAWWHLPTSFDEPLTAPRVFAHLAYLQDVLEETPLSAAIWTVCIEMQFYVVCVLGWWLAQQLRFRSEPKSARPSAAGLMFVFVPLALMSLFCWNRLTNHDPWVTYYLSRFFLGMVTWWVLDRTVPPLVFAISIAVVTGHLLFHWDQANAAENALSLTAALALFIVGRTGHFHDWLNWRWLQYLGRISYSLYLIHYPVSHYLTWFAWRWCDNSPTPIQSCLILLSCLVASIIAGHLLYVSVEVPAGRWSAWLKARRLVG